MMNNENSRMSESGTVKAGIYDRSRIIGRRQLDALSSKLIKLISDIDYLSMMTEVELEGGDEPNE